jgi:stage V sporulation protein D (sporulation-specific penicillin-binding protein)
MWSNKAVSETYEPGSTFKIITVAAAVDSGAAAFNDTFSCHGYQTVSGWRIKCHKVTGHGSGFTLSYGLQMSCNPTMMQIAERTGAETFYSYVEKFGYFEKSGIDLPSEAGTIFHKPENIGTTELATASFGQRFKVSIINHLRAIASVANGGYLVTPHVVEKIVDNNGDVIYEFESDTSRRTISESTAKQISQALEEGVSGNGGAKNACVEGYLVAAKTGTSEKFDVLDENGNSYLRIGSTVAYSISDSEDIAVIIVVDEPHSQVKYGSIVAAPYVSALLTNVLPYLEFESSKVTESVEVPNLVGMSVSSAKGELNKLNIKFEIIGDGDIVLFQTPTAGNYIESIETTLYLYTEEEGNEVSVPNLSGKDISEAVSICISLGLNVSIRGFDSGNVVSQSLPPGELVKKGEIIKLTVLTTDFED